MHGVNTNGDSRPMKRLQDIKIDPRDVVEEAIDNRNLTSTVAAYFSGKITEKAFLEDLNQLLTGVETDIKMRLRDTANMDEKYPEDAA